MNANTITRIAIEWTDTDGRTRVTVIPADRLQGVAIGIADSAADLDRCGADVERYGSLDGLSARLEEVLG